MTILLAFSAAGEKLKPQLIGKSAKPRCFKGVDKAAIPVTYRANRKAWMTGVLFKEWLQNLNNSMKVQGRNILLFIDNCAAHPGLTMLNIKMVFLPPNMTSRLQLCDAGIIAALKAHYRKRLMRHVLSEMDDAQTASQLSKRVDMLDAIRWVHLAWASVSDTTITKCFAKCGVGVEAPGDTEEVVVQQPEGPAYDTLLGTESWADFVSMDNATRTTDIISDDWESALITKAREDVLADGASSEEDEQEEQAELPPTVLTNREALGRVNELVDYATRTGNAAMLDAVTTVQGLVQEHCIKQATFAKQKSITDFFTAK